MAMTSLAAAASPLADSDNLNLERSERRFRAFVRFGLEGLARALASGSVDDQTRRHRDFEAALASSPMAVEEDAANQQHYEVPSAFFAKVLGARLKYSACYFPGSVTDLDQAEEISLAQVCERARLQDGQRVLDLGCGWGSNSLYIAERFPNSTVVALSGASNQRAFLEAQAAARGLRNLTVITAPVAEAEPPGPFDRIVSIEMMEHVRNWPALLERMQSWLTPQGLAFVHVFVHKTAGYLYDGTDVTARHYFTGGIMPSKHLMYCFNEAMRVIDHWAYDGVHYAKTARCWLDRLEAERDGVLDIFGRRTDPDAAEQRYVHWRNFFALVEESFGFRDGTEWLIGHYLLAPRAADGSA